MRHSSGNLGLKLQPGVIGQLFYPFSSPTPGISTEPRKWKEIQFLVTTNLF